MRRAAPPHTAAASAPLPAPSALVCATAPRDRVARAGRCLAPTQDGELFGSCVPRCAMASGARARRDGDIIIDLSRKASVREAENA